MGVHMMEAMMRPDPSKGELNVDIQNMFNTLCRVALLEDVITSPEDLGVDFREMLKYLDMTYGCESSLWFKIDAYVDAATGKVQPAEGVHGRGKARAGSTDRVCATIGEAVHERSTRGA